MTEQTRELRALRDTIIGLLIAAPLVFLEQLVHELLHLALNGIASESVSLSCGDVGPLIIKETGRLAVCHFGSGIGPWNDLLTPSIMAFISIGLMVYSARISYRPARWAVFGSGVTSWLMESLYSMGYFTVPRVVNGVVHYSGDGTDALAAFGSWAMVPGGLALIVGAIVVVGRTDYDRGTIDVP